MTQYYNSIIYHWPVKYNTANTKIPWIYNEQQSGGGVDAISLPIHRIDIAIGMIRKIAEVFDKKKEEKRGWFVV